MKLLNAFSLQMIDLPATVHCWEIEIKPGFRSVEERVAWFLQENGGVESCVGHADTAALFSDLLGITVAHNRATVTLQKGTDVIVGQLIGGRLPEGSKTLPPGAKIKWIMVQIS